MASPTPVREARRESLSYPRQAQEKYTGPQTREQPEAKSISTVEVRAHAMGEAKQPRVMGSRNTGGEWGWLRWLKEINPLSSGWPQRRRGFSRKGAAALKQKVLALSGKVDHGKRQVLRPCLELHQCAD